MSGYKNFQQDNFKYTKESSRLPDNPAFNSQVKVDDIKKDSFEINIEKWIEFVQWSKWFPDLWYDLIKPDKGGMRLDLDQRLFLRCMSRFISTYGVFPRGFGKCQSGDTILFTNEGMKELGSYFDYKNDDNESYIDSKISLVNRYGELESTNAGVYSGKKDTKIVKTEELYESENTLNHPILVMTNNGLVWKRTLDLEIGDYLPIRRDINVFGNNIKTNINMNSFVDTLDKSSKWKILKVKSNIVHELTEELALIMGYLVGDGTMTRPNSIMFTSKDEDMIEIFTNYFTNVLGMKVKKKNDIDYLINGIYVREMFNQLGLKQVTSFDKEIPQLIMTAPKNIVSKFIMGLFDTDGGISNSHIEYCTASEKLSKQVQTVLLNFGIISTRTKKYNKKFKTYAYTICIFSKNIESFREQIGFSCGRKKAKLDDICGKRRNVNKDVIPYMSNIVSEVYLEVKGNNPYLYDKLYNVMKGNNELTYEKLDLILSLNDIENSKHYSTLIEIKENNYFFSKVKSIETSSNHVYDLSLPKTHSFIANGFVSHNTMLEIMSIYHTAIFFPDCNLAMSAQTKENAASISEDKHKELIKKFPLINNEITKANFSKDTAEVIFKSGGTYSILANAQSTKGQRRHRLNIEESALLNNELFKDALEPVVNVPRRTIGEQSVINPYELNGMINYVTTSGYRGSDEFNRILGMIDEMAELKGKMVLGASWELPCHYGRGETRNQLLAKKNDPTTSSTLFAMNYESRWVNLKRIAHYKSCEPRNLGCESIYLIC